MTILKRYHSLPLFWQVYIFIVLVLVLVVGITEFVLEPLAEKTYLGTADLCIDWYEGPAWAVSILLASLACGVIISKKLTSRLESMAWAAKAFSRGNFETRLPEAGNEKDVFDVLAGSFNQMAEAIERQLHNERRLLADISHELRSPLSRMAVAVALIDRKKENPENVSALRRLDKEIRHMGELVELLLEQAQERNAQTKIAENLNLGQATQDIVGDFELLALEQNKSIEATVEKGLAIWTSPLMLQRILGNVLANAVFYTPENTKVLVRVSQQGEYAKIIVRDAGPGVPEKQLDDIFRAFYRVDDSRTRTSGGTGLGLALAKNAVLHLGGRMSARNAFPGLEVSILLPLSLPPGNG